MYICDRFQRSARKASKKSAITRSTRLQRQELRLCPISLLIVNTRSNQNEHAVVRSVVEGALKDKKLTPENVQQLSSALPNFEPGPNCVTNRCSFCSPTSVHWFKSLTRRGGHCPRSVSTLRHPTPKPRSLWRSGVQPGAPHPKSPLHGRGPCRPEHEVTIHESSGVHRASTSSVWQCMFHVWRAPRRPRSSAQCRTTSFSPHATIGSVREFRPRCQVPVRCCFVIESPLSKQVMHFQPHERIGFVRHFSVVPSPSEPHSHRRFSSATVGCAPACDAPHRWHSWPVVFKHSCTSVNRPLKVAARAFRRRTPEPLPV